MTSLFLTLLVIFTIGVLGVAMFMLWWARRVSHLAITRQFQAAEFILEHHAPPPDWRRPPGPVSRIRQAFRPDSKHAPSPDATSPAKHRLLERLDKVIAFFETSPFFEDEETRRELLTQLNNERAAWQSKSAAELLAAE